MASDASSQKFWVTYALNKLNECRKKLKTNFKTYSVKEWYALTLVSNCSHVISSKRPSILFKYNNKLLKRQ